MTRKTFSYLILPVIVAVSLLGWAEPATAQHGGSHGGGGFRGGNYHGARDGSHPNYRSYHSRYGYRPYFSYGFYPYGYGDGDDPDYDGYGLSPYPWVDPSVGYDSWNVPEPQRIVELSGEFPAVLTLEFPAPAEVWLDGKKVEGKAAAVRTISSPILKPGDRYTFHVKAGWTVKGQTYGYNRDVTLETGARSRLLVLLGTPAGGR
jgi:uncharacterized protein (TIGR03000 family)